ncbi:MAG: hypothetical protein FJ044_04315, partial [Candidatus Cloacimonetes bacterium]|nr:hypothetical protein [Candidatus Cloacimonadota bacterium]
MNEGKLFTPKEALGFDAERQQRDFLGEAEATKVVVPAREYKNETGQSHRREGVVEVKKSPEGRPDIDVTFLYVIHSTEAGSEYVNRVLDKVANADLILIEGVGLTKRMRRLDKLVFKALSVAAEKAPNNFIVRELTEILRHSDSFQMRVIGEVLGKGKEVDYIDVAKGEPGYTEAIAAYEMSERITTFAEEGEIEEALQLYPELINMFAESSKIREKVVVGQLKKRLEGIKGKKQVVVLQGAVHTSVYHMVKQMELIHSLEYVPLISSYPPGAILIREKRFLQREPSQDDYRRAFIGDYLFIPGSKEIWPGTPLPEIDSLSTELSSRLN